MSQHHSAKAASADANHDEPHSPFAEDAHCPDAPSEDNEDMRYFGEEKPEELVVNSQQQQPPQEHTKTAPVAASPPGPAHKLPDDVVFRKDPDKDDMGYKAVLESITNPQTFGFVRAAFRTVAFVSFPMFTIAVHPNTMMRLGYPQMMIAAVVSTSVHQGSIGMQIGLHTWLWRGVTYMLIWGTVVDAWNLANHEGAWYGMLALGIFLASMVTHGLMRRFMYLYFFLYILEIRAFSAFYSVIPMNSAAWTAADFFLGSVWGIAALCFPYPILTRTLLNMIMAKIFEGFGKMFMAMITFVWMPDAHVALLFYNDRSPFMKIEAILDMMAPLLWFTNWEPMEFPLHNPIRRLKLTLLRRVIALTYAAFGAGHAVSMFRCRQAEQKALHQIRVTLFQATYGRNTKAIEDAASASADDNNDNDDASPDSPPLNVRAGTPHKDSADPKTAKESAAALRENSAKCVKEFGLALMQAVTALGTVANTPEQIVKKVPIDKLRETQTQMRRALRLEMLQVMKMESDLVAQRLAKRQRDDEHAQQQQQQDDEVQVEDDNSPYGRTHRYNIGRADAISILENKGIIEEGEVYVRLSELFFHGLMAMIAGEIISFGEQMKEYKPPMSLGRRLLNFYIIEPWHDFWEELWCIMTLARPADVRKMKDAIRMTCAYLSATALNLELYFIPGGVYYFGTTLLLGLPVEEESLGMSVNRMAGNALGCALGFMAYHNTHNLAQKLAMTLCFVFILRTCKDHPMYGQTFMYAAAITMAGMATTANPLQLMTRLISSNYTVIAYMLCIMFIFPNNNIKICWGYRCKLTKAMSEVVDDLVDTLRIAPTMEPSFAGNTNDEGNNSSPVAYPHRNTQAMQMCSHLNIQMALAERLLGMCDKWAPFAARQHVIRGMAPFPAAASATVQFAHKRMMAHLRMLVFGVQLLHRPRTAPVSDITARLLAGSLTDFMAEFAGLVRLVSQDFIDSLQASRKWSYPLTLSHTSQVSWLRVRLAAIHLEVYVLAARHMSKSVFAMKPEDYRLLQEESRVFDVRDRAPANTGAVGENNNTDNDNRSHSESDRNVDLQHNMSFADRFLHARLMGDSFVDNNEADPARLEELHNSIYLPQPRQESTSLFLGGAPPQKSFAFHLPLQESTAQPNDAFPFTQDSAERDVQQHLKEEKMAAKLKKRESQLQQADAAHTAAVEGSAGRGRADDAPPSSVFEPVAPRRTKSKMSRLILVPEEGPELEIPLYRGPAFTYVEDELATEKDTDFSAIMIILCSCFSFITELEGLTGPMNAISTYQKDLHESSMAIGLIDRMSEKVTAYRKRIHDRYHFPTPQEDMRRPLHAQSDPFADWRF